MGRRRKQKTKLTSITEQLPKLCRPIMDEVHIETRESAYESCSDSNTPTLVNVNENVPENNQPDSRNQIRDIYLNGTNFGLPVDSKCLYSGADAAPRKNKIVVVRDIYSEYSVDTIFQIDEKSVEIQTSPSISKRMHLQRKATQEKSTSVEFPDPFRFPNHKIKKNEVNLLGKVSKSIKDFESLENASISKFPAELVTHVVSEEKKSQSLTLPKGKVLDFFKKIDNISVATNNNSEKILCIPKHSGKACKVLPNIREIANELMQVKLIEDKTHDNNGAKKVKGNRDSKIEARKGVTNFNILSLFGVRRRVKEPIKKAVIELPIIPVAKEIIEKSRDTDAKCEGLTECQGDKTIEHVENAKKINAMDISTNSHLSINVKNNSQCLDLKEPISIPSEPSVCKKSIRVCNKDRKVKHFEKRLQNLSTISSNDSFEASWNNIQLKSSKTTSTTSKKKRCRRSKKGTGDGIPETKHVKLSYVLNEHSENPSAGDTSPSACQTIEQKSLLNPFERTTVKPPLLVRQKGKTFLNNDSVLIHADINPSKIPLVASASKIDSFNQHGETDGNDIKTKGDESTSNRKISRKRLKAKTGKSATKKSSVSIPKIKHREIEIKSNFSDKNSLEVREINILEDFQKLEFFIPTVEVHKLNIPKRRIETKSKSPISKKTITDTSSHQDHNSLKMLRSAMVKVDVKPASLENRNKCAKSFRKLTLQNSTPHKSRESAVDSNINDEIILKNAASEASVNNHCVDVKLVQPIEGANKCKREVSVVKNNDDSLQAIKSINVDFSKLTKEKEAKCKRLKPEFRLLKGSFELQKTNPNAKIISTTPLDDKVKASKREYSKCKKLNNKKNKNELHTKLLPVGWQAKAALKKDPTSHEAFALENKVQFSSSAEVKGLRNLEPVVECQICPTSLTRSLDIEQLLSKLLLDNFNMPLENNLQNVVKNNTTANNFNETPVLLRNKRYKQTPLQRQTWHPDEHLPNNDKADQPIGSKLKIPAVNVFDFSSKSFLPTDANQPRLRKPRPWSTLDIPPIDCNFINDDHLFPESITPTKLPSCNWINEEQYNVPYIDDKALPEEEPEWALGESRRYIMSASPIVKQLEEEFECNKEIQIYPQGKGIVNQNGMNRRKCNCLSCIRRKH